MQPLHGSGQNSETVGRAFLGVLKQELHAEADAEHRLRKLRQLRGESRRTEPPHRIASRADAGQDHPRGCSDLGGIARHARFGPKPLESELERGEIRSA